MSGTSIIAQTMSLTSIQYSRERQYLLLDRQMNVRQTIASASDEMTNCVSIYTVTDRQTYKRTDY